MGGLMGTVTGFYYQLLWNRPQQPRAAISQPNGPTAESATHTPLWPQNTPPPPRTANHPNSVTDNL